LVECSKTADFRGRATCGKDPNVDKPFAKVQGRKTGSDGQAPQNSQLTDDQNDGQVTPSTNGLRVSSSP